MNFSLPVYTDYEYLKDAAEIAVEYRERNRVLRLLENFPKATIMLIHRLSDPEIEWDLMRDFNTMAAPADPKDVTKKNRFLLQVTSMRDVMKAKELGIRFFLDYPFTSYYELQAFDTLHPAYVRLGSPLFFELPTVKLINTPIRAVVNQAYADGFPRRDGRTGLWIRPEDTEVYSEYIDMFEFAPDPRKDFDQNKRYIQALYRIYTSRDWPGELGMIIQNFDYPCLNRMMYPEATEARINCGHVCQIPGRSCHICHGAIRLADETKIAKFKEERG